MASASSTFMWPGMRPATGWMAYFTLITQTDSLLELQALVTGLNNAATALGDFAQANTTGLANATGTVPDLAAYTAAGVTGVNAGNLAAINDALASAPITAAIANSPSELQTLVDAYNAILGEANDTTNTAGDSTADATPTIDPTAAQYAAIGADIGAAATDTENLALLNDILGAKQTADVDTIAEINELARIANAIQTVASGGTTSPALTVVDLTTVGIANVTPDNLAAVLAAIAAGNDNGTQTDSLLELQTLVNALNATGNLLGDFAQFFKILMQDKVTKFGKPVIIMLDPDAAGIKGNIKARRQLSLLGVDCRIIVPPKDPKLLSRKELECLLT